MNARTFGFVSTLAWMFFTTATAFAQDGSGNRWTLGEPVLSAGPKGAFDEVAVKDPTVVFFEGAWHLFYTARGRDEYTTGYVSAKDLVGLRSAPRYELPMIRGNGRYGCAPQVFLFSPQKKWYLIFQNRDANYQPAFSTTSNIAGPRSWSDPQRLLVKDNGAKWIDFWVICDTAKAYLFYTQGHDEVIVRSTSLEDFPRGWKAGKTVLDGIHEAVHIYRVRGRDEFHMIYELNRGGVRSFGLATAGHLEGPWTKVTDDYATGEQLVPVGDGNRWTEMVSHGELIRAGYDERIEYEPAGCRWLIQGLRKKDMNRPYPSLPWQLGVITKSN